METYLIGICNRLHDASIILGMLSIIFGVIFSIIYFDERTNIKLGWSTEKDNKLLKASKKVLISCLIIFIISFLICIFIPTGEEISLMIAK